MIIAVAVSLWCWGWSSPLAVLLLHSSPKPGMLTLFQEHVKLCECVRAAHASSRACSANGGRGKATPRLM